MMGSKVAGTIRLAAGALAGLALTVFVGGAVAAGGTVTFVTPFDGTQTLVVNGTTLGDFPYYIGISRITFSWTPYWGAYVPGPMNVASPGHAYRVAVWQNTTPLASTPTWVPIHVSDHWTDNPNPTTFTFDSFVDIENVCHDCPSMIVVQAETVQYDPGSTGDSPFVYTPVSAANSAGVPAMMKSGPFLIISNVRLRDVDACSEIPAGPLHEACEDEN